MTLSRTFDPPQRRTASKSYPAVFNKLALYRFCIAIAVLDFADIYDFIDFNTVAKYSFAAVILAFMAIYFLRWKKMDAAVAPTIFLLFFIVTGLVFALRFFIYDERNSYVTAFISPLVFAAAIFIPPNSLVVDARKVVRDLTILFSVGTVFYLIEAIIRPFGFIHNGPDEVNLLKSLSCVVAICLSILTGRKTLALVLACITVAALELRPTSTLVLGLVCCVPIAIALRPRVTSFRPISVLLGRTITMTVFISVVSIPLLLFSSLMMLRQQ